MEHHDDRELEVGEQRVEEEAVGQVLLAVAELGLAGRGRAVVVRQRGVARLLRQVHQRALRMQLQAVQREAEVAGKQQRDGLPGRI